MKSLWINSLAVAFLCLAAPFAFADTVSMRSINQSFLKWGGQHVSTHDAQISKAGDRMRNPEIALKVICLDIVVNTFVECSYLHDRRFTFNEGLLTYGAMNPATQDMYQVVARLGHQLMNTPALTNTQRDRIAFAIWNASKADASGSLSQRHRDAIDLLIANPATQSWKPDFHVFTPPDGYGNYSSPPPRVMSVSVPEASAAAMLGMCLFGLFGLVLTLRRRVEQQ